MFFTVVYFICVIYILTITLVQQTKEYRQRKERSSCCSLLVSELQKLILKSEVSCLFALSRLSRVESINPTHLIILV